MQTKQAGINKPLWTSQTVTPYDQQCSVSTYLQITSENSLVRQILVQQIGTVVHHLSRLPSWLSSVRCVPTRLQRSPKLPGQKEACSKILSTLKVSPEPSQYFMLYHPSGNVTHFVQLAHCESDCISLQAERQLQCPCRSCCGEFELVVPGRNDASAPLAKILSASFQKGCPETFTIARAWIVHESKDCLDSRCIKR